MHKHRPVSLHSTIRPPLLEEVSSDRSIALGLEVTINMFKIIDHTFVNLWNRADNSRTSAAWITQVQTQLSEAVPEFLECTKVQEVQIRMTQQWLRSQIWQLSLCQGLVSSTSYDNSLTFKYPVDIAGDLLMISDQFSQQVMEVHGTGLVSTTGSPLVSSSFNLGVDEYPISLHPSVQQSVFLFNSTKPSLLAGNVYR